MRYLLDTNICIYFANRQPPVTARITATRQGELAMSVVTYCELMFGALKSKRIGENIASVELLRTLIAVLPLQSDVAHQFGRIRVALERRGTPIGPFDMLIAAHALAANLILVTNNHREFSRVPGLKIENWAE